MAEPYLAEIRIFGFNFAPRGWAQCDGQLLPINQNQALYSLLGTNFGGDGRTSFGLPELRGRTAIHLGDNGISSIGQRSGQEAVNLTTSQIPSHQHTLRASSNDAISATGANNLLGRSSTPIYHSPANLVDMKASAPPAVTDTGNNQGHNNMQPFQVLNFCIALQGVFPSRN